MTAEPKTTPPSLWGTPPGEGLTGPEADQVTFECLFLTLMACFGRDLRIPRIARELTKVIDDDATIAMFYEIKDLTDIEWWLESRSES